MKKAFLIWLYECKTSSLFQLLVVSILQYLSRTSHWGAKFGYGQRRGLHHGGLSKCVYASACTQQLDMNLALNHFNIRKICISVRPCCHPGPTASLDYQLLYGQLLYFSLLLRPESRIVATFGLVSKIPWHLTFACTVCRHIWQDGRQKNASAPTLYVMDAM